MLALGIFPSVSICVHLWLNLFFLFVSFNCHPSYCSLNSVERVATVRAMKSWWLDESGNGVSKVLLLLIAMLGFIGCAHYAQAIPRAGAPSNAGKENGGREYVRLTE